MPNHSMRFRISLLVVFLISFLSVRSVSAATLTVTTTADSGPGSLRQALSDAAPGDTINFAVSGIIQIIGHPLTIAHDLTLNGPGASTLAIQGDPAYGALYITAGTVTLSGLTIQHAPGAATNDGDGLRIKAGTVTLDSMTFANNAGTFGSAIQNSGTLTIQNSLFTGNLNPNCCGDSVIENDQGTFLIQNSLFTGNPGDGNSNVVNNLYGGGTIAHSTFTHNGGTVLRTGGYDPQHSVLITDSLLNDNQTSAITDSDTILTIERTTIRGNTAGQGAALFLNGGTVTIDQSTLSGNTAVNGGAIFIQSGGHIIVSNSTLTGNVTTGQGGAVEVYGTASFVNSTIARNQGGAVYILPGSPNALFLQNTIVANNQGINCVGATAADFGHNLQYGDASCGATIPVADPLLGALTDNGGGTQTLALLPGSPALGGGDPHACMIAPVSSLDQRGLPRLAYGLCDIGAYEHQGASPTAPPTNTAIPPTLTATPTFTATDLPTSSPSPTNTDLPTATDLPTQQPSLTLTNTDLPTLTATSTATNTDVPTATNSASPTSSATWTSTATNTPTTLPAATNTSTNTALPSATRTATLTRTPLPSPSRTATLTRTPLPTVIPATSTPVGTPSVKVQLQNGGNDSTQQAQFNYKLVNTGSSAVAGLSVRIYIRLDGTQPISKYVIEKYWDQSGNAQIAAPVQVSGGLYYYAVAYSAALPAGASWEFHSALHLSDWTNNFSAANDPWHNGYVVGALPSAFTDTPGIMAYSGTTLVWGTVPQP